MSDLSKVTHLSVAYIGKDKGYVDVIKHRYRERFPNLTIKFLEYSFTGPLSYTGIFVNIVEAKPQVIYVDFTYDLSLSQKLSRFCRRENELKDSVIIGLIDKKSAVRACRSCGTHFIHIKCAEYHDVIYDPMRFLFPDGVKPDKYATAKLDKEINLVNLFRVGFISSTYIHVEGDLKLEVGQTIKIESKIPKEIVPSKQYIVKKIYETDLYYDYKYAYDLEFVYVDPPAMDIDAEVEIMLAGAENNEDEKEKIKKKLEQKAAEEQTEYQELLKRSKKKTAEWVLEKSYDSKPKTTKVFIIDKGLSLLRQSDKDIESYPCSFRFQTFLDENLNALKRNRPNIIVFQFLSESYESLLEKPEYDENRAKEVLDKMKDEAKEQLDNTVDFIKKTEGYDPIVLVFNCPYYTTENTRMTYSYDQIMVRKESVDFDTIVSMASLFEKKEEKKFHEATTAKIMALRKENPMKNGKLQVSDFVEKRFYLSRSDSQSFVSTDYTVNILKVNESEVVISTPDTLQLINYDLKFPVDMSIRLVTIDGKDYLEEQGKKIYFGLVHSTSEDEKKELRRYVNEIFCEPASEERAKEAAEFKELNEKAAAKKAEEEAKAAAEAAAKLAAEKEAQAAEGEKDNPAGPDSEKAS